MKIHDLKVSIPFLIFIMCVSMLPDKKSKDVILYVSTTGSDLNSGKKAKKAFATLTRARDEIRILKKSNPDQSFRVLLSGGKYFMNKPFILEAGDSGSDKSAIVYEALYGAKVRLIGGVEIKSSLFENLSPTDPSFNMVDQKVRDHIKVLDLKKAGITDFGKMRKRGFSYRTEPSPMELSVNNRLQQLARWPDKGYSASGKPVDSTGFSYAAPEIEKWVNEKDGWTLGYWRVGWAETYLPIDEIDTKNKTIRIANITNGRITSYARIGNNRNWCAINILSELTVPGEYYIDRDNGRLYVFPPSQTDFSTAEILLSVLGENMEFIVEANEVKNVVFRNLSMEVARNGAFSATDCENLLIGGCTFRGTGNTALRLSGKNISVLGSTIYDSGAGGIQISGGDRTNLASSGNLVENCHIYHFGIWNRTYAPAVQISGVGTTVRNCRFNDSPHSAILFGGNNHLIELNEFFNTCYETDDAGTIYCGRDWALYGTIIRHNYLHDIASAYRDKNEKSRERLGVHGIYLDDCASGITVFGNIFNNISGRAVMCGGGRYNKIDNNIIVFCGAAHFTDRRGKVWVVDQPGAAWNLLEKLQKLNYTKPPWSTAYPTLARIMDEGYDMAKEPVGCEITNNIGFNNEMWLEKNCLGACNGFDFYHFEGNIENEDPMFIDKLDPLKGIKKESPVSRIKGFKEIPFNKIGLK